MADKDFVVKNGLVVANGNISVTGTVDGRDVATDGTKLDGIESGATADQTASEILTAIKTVDGAASGLDADLLDGQQGTYYLDFTNATNIPDPVITLTGAVTGSGTMTDLGSVSITTTATSDPTLTLAGDVSGSATFTNLGNATLTVVVADDSHNHIISNVDGLQTALDAKLDSASYTAADVLTKVKTVDGAASGLDADLLDGQQGSYYLDWTNTTNKPDPVITLAGDLSGSVTLTDLTSGTLTATVGTLNQNTTGNAATATTLQTPRTIGGVSFDGSANINLPGVNTNGNQNTTGSAATLTTARAIQVSGAVTGTANFDGSAAINIVTTHTADPVITLTGAVTGSGTMTNLGSVSIATTATADPTLTLAGDATGSATFTNLGNATLTVAIVDDSHNHSSSSGNFTTNGTFYGLAGTTFDPSGGSGTDTSTTAAYAFDTGSAIVGVHNGYIRNMLSWTSSSDITIGQGGTSLIGGINLIAGSSGNVKVNGQRVFAEDYHPNADTWTTARTITLGGVLSGSVSIDGSGDVTLTAAHTSDPVITLTGAVTGSGTMTNLGSVSIATTATADPTLTLAGDASGSATFTNLGNATLTVVVADDSHTHDTRYYTETEIDTKLTNGTVTKLANQWSNVTGNFSGYVNDGGGNLGLRFNATSNATNNLVENGIAYELEVGNDTSTGNLVFYKGSTSTGTAGETITWTDAFRISGVDNYLYAYGQKIFNDTYHPNADAWTTARTITLGGVLSGSTSIDGSGNVTLTAAHTSDPVITLTGAVTGTGTMTNLGSVSIATTATSDPTLTLAGDATGSATFTNLGNATLTVAVVDDSHNHSSSSGNFTVNGILTTTANTTIGGSLQIDGDLTVSGETVTINVTELAVEDNMIYLNSGSAVTNPDLGFVGNYNDGTYAHAGFFRDATDGYFKPFKGYTLEPDASAFIDTSHASFALADIQAANFRGALVGNASTATTLQTARTIGGVSFNGSANINLPGVNTAGNQNTSGNAASATILQTTRTINGVNFNGSANIVVEPYVEDAVSTSVTRYITFVDNSTAGYKRLNEDSDLTYNPGTNTLTVPTVVAALTGNATTATTLQTARTIALSGAATGTATSFNGGANITIPVTALNASDLSSGTVPDARISGSYTGMINLTGTGNVDFAKFLGNAADSVTAPSFSWTGDTNTGMYQPAADQIGFATGGTQRVLVNSSGLTVNSGRLNATEINGNAGQQLILFAGESAGSSGYTGLTNELVYVVAEGGFQIISSSNNWTDSVNGGWTTANPAVTINDSSGNSNFPGTVTAGSFSGPLSGNAATASAWQTARTITLGGVLSGSVSLDGSGNVTLTAAHTSDPVITLTGAVTGSGTMTNLGSVSIATTATADPTLTLAGDATGSATFTNLGNATLTVTVADDSHNHIIANVDGLQTALDGKLATGAKAADSNLLDGIDSASFLRSDADDTFTGNLTTGADNHITFGPNSGWNANLRIGGNGRTVSGDVSASVVTTNGNLHLDSGGNKATYLNYYAGTGGTFFGSGAGSIVAVMGSDGDLWKGGADNTGSRYFHDAYHPNADTWTTARTLTLSGAVTGSVSINGSGDVTLATTATSDPTLTLAGDATGSATFTNLGNATLTVAVVDDSHNHIISNVDGLQTALDGKLPLTGGTITGTLTLDNGTTSQTSLVMKGTSPTISFLDDDTNADDFYIHINSNRFYVLTNRDDGQVDTVGGDWETPFPLELRSDTNQGFLFGSRMFADDYHPNADTLTTARTIALSGAATGTATSFNGSANITIPVTALNASNLNAGTVPDARITGSYTGMANLTGSGNVDFAKFLGNAADLVTAPSYSWTGDTNTGMWQPGADQIGFATNGVSRLNITTTAITSTLAITAPTFTGALSGNATTATSAGNADTWTTARTLSLTGAVTGSVSIDGSGDVSLATTATSDPTLTLSGDLSGSATFTNLGNATLTAQIGANVVNANELNVTGNGTAGQALLSDGDGTFSWGSPSASVAFNDLTSKTSGTGNYTTTGTFTAATFNATSTTDGGFQGIDADSITAPSFTWTSDLNTGMWHPGADQIGFTTGGVSRLNITTTAITTALPLTVTGDLTVTSNILPNADNTGVVGSAALTWNNGQFTNLTVDGTLNVRAAIDLADSDEIRFGSSDDFRIYYDGTANEIEFEMEAACSQIRIHDNGTTRFTLARATGNLTATGLIEAIGFYQSSTGTGNGFRGNGGDSASFPAFTWNNDEDTGMYRAGANDLGFTTAGVSRCVINGSTATFSVDVVANSDSRLKKDIENIANALEKVNKLNGVNFTKIENDRRSTGLIAQDVQAVLPEAVSENNEGYLSVAYGNMVGLLVEAIKEQDSTINSLRNDVETLKELLNKLMETR